jgi:hypothetical protein
MIVQFADNKELHKEWIAAKTARKEKLAAYIKDKTGYTVSPSSLFDIQVHPGCRDAILRPCLTFTHTCLHEQDTQYSKTVYPFKCEQPS